MFSFIIVAFFILYLTFYFIFFHQFYFIFNFIYSGCTTDDFLGNYFPRYIACYLSHRCNSIVTHS